MRVLTAAALALFSVLSAATPGFAQSDDDSHWGVVFHYTPEWKVAKGLLEDLWSDGKPNKLTGNEFQIGVARGRMQSGDWGATFVRRKVTPGSTTGDVCIGFNDCEASGIKHIFNDDVTLTGFEVHKFVPFVTIARRVQVGLNFSGGLGVWSGTATRQEYVVTNFQTGAGRVETTPGVDVKTLFVMEKAPIGKLELAFAGIIGKGIKARAGIGMDFPGYPVFSVSGIYLFGSE